MKTAPSFSEILLKVARRNSISSVFSDFLEMSVCALSMGAKEERYLEIVGRYEKTEVNLMAEAFGALVIEMDNGGEGMKDVFGDFFMEYISHGHNGQFFTPEPICDMMAQMNEPIHDGAGVLDCACGSGRILMAAAKLNRNALFYGADVDRNCAMMSAINFCLNGMFGEVAWMNSLSNQFYGGWAIRPYPGYGNPYLVQITEAESVICLKLPETKEQVKVKQEIQPIETDIFDDILSSGSGQQLSLF